MKLTLQNTTMKDDIKLSSVRISIIGRRNKLPHFTLIRFEL